ncbi:hypothetical protein EZS27_044225, partial [termite gut metagenome]
HDTSVLNSASIVMQHKNIAIIFENQGLRGRWQHLASLWQHLAQVNFNIPIKTLPILIISEENISEHLRTRICDLDNKYTNYG